MNHNELFYNRLSELINKSGKSFNQVERELGYPRNALCNYKQKREPKASRLIEVANYFDVTPEYLIGKSDISEPLNPQNFFNTLSQQQKLEMISICQHWILSQFP